MRFQLGFDWVNLHRPTSTSRRESSSSPAISSMARCATSAVASAALQRLSAAALAVAAFPVLAADFRSASHSVVSAA